MPDAPANPFSELDPVQNVSTSLDFLVQRAINAKDPEAAYADDLIRAVAASPASEREKTKLRLAQNYHKDFSKRRFLAAVKEAMLDLMTHTPGSDLIISENGAIKPILANAVIELKAIKLSLDTFSYRVVTLEPTPWGTCGVWRDADNRAAAEWLQHKGVGCASTIAREAAMRVADQNQFSSLKQWLDDLKWDGEPRLDTWLTEYLGSEDTNYVRAIGAAWCISAVARGQRPGCKADHMLLLEGPQGKRKSMALRALVNGHLDSDCGLQRFGDDPPGIDHKDIKQWIQGLWIIELAELDAIRGKEWSAVKRFVSTQSDRFRAPYGYETDSYGRQCVFSASTNEDHWAGDPTGSRRHWPVKVGKVDIDGLLRDSQQIWAEAQERFDAGAKWWLDDEMEGVAREEQASRQPDDPWISRLDGALALDSDTSVREMLDKFSQVKDASSHKIARALIELGWVRYQKRIGNARDWRYRRPAD